MIPAMQHCKEYYESLIRVIDCLASGQKEISPQEGEELAGPYWNDIGFSLKSEKHIYFHNNRLQCEQTLRLPSLRKQALDAIAVIDKADKDRKLNNLGIIIAICCGVGGLILSIISLIRADQSDSRMDELENRVTILESRVTILERSGPPQK